MLKNVTGAATALFEGVETITEKSVGIANDSLDILAEEISISLEATKATRPAKLELAKLEADYEVRKAKLKLTGKLSALEKLVLKTKPTEEGN